MLSRTFGPWEVDLNAGAARLGRVDADGRDRQGVGSLAVTWAFLPGWNASLDTVAPGRHRFRSTDVCPGPSTRTHLHQLRVTGSLSPMAVIRA